jgi:hypothetical protein
MVGAGDKRRGCARVTGCWSDWFKGSFGDMAHDDLHSRALALAVYCTLFVMFGWVSIISTLSSTTPRVTLACTLVSEIVIIRPPPRAAEFGQVWGEGANTPPMVRVKSSCGEYMSGINVSVHVLDEDDLDHSLESHRFVGLKRTHVLGTSWNVSDSQGFAQFTGLSFGNGYPADHKVFFRFAGRPSSSGAVAEAARVDSMHATIGAFTRVAQLAVGAAPAAVTIGAQLGASVLAVDSAGSPLPNRLIQAISSRGLHLSAATGTTSATPLLDGWFELLNATARTGADGVARFSGLRVLGGSGRLLSLHFFSEGASVLWQRSPAAERFEEAPGGTGGGGSTVSQSALATAALAQLPADGTGLPTVIDSSSHAWWSWLPQRQCDQDAAAAVGEWPCGSSGAGTGGAATTTTTTAVLAAALTVIRAPPNFTLEGTAFPPGTMPRVQVAAADGSPVGAGRTVVAKLSRTAGLSLPLAPAAGGHNKVLQHAVARTDAAGVASFDRLGFGQRGGGGGGVFALSFCCEGVCVAACPAASYAAQDLPNASAVAGGYTAAANASRALAVAAGAIWSRYDLCVIGGGG